MPSKAGQLRCPGMLRGVRKRLIQGLLELHSRYGPSDRSVAQGDLCHEAPALPITQLSRSSATGSIDNSPGGIFLHR